MILAVTFSTIFWIALISLAIGLFFGIATGIYLVAEEKKEKEAAKVEKENDTKNI